MNTNVKVNYGDSPDVFMEIYHKNERRKERRKMSIIQKCMGAALIAVGCVSMLILEGDATAFCVCVVLGGYLILSRKNWLEV